MSFSSLAVLNLISGVSLSFVHKSSEESPYPSIKARYINFFCSLVSVLTFADRQRWAKDMFWQNRIDEIVISLTKIILVSNSFLIHSHLFPIFEHKLHTMAVLSPSKRMFLQYHVEEDWSIRKYLDNLRSFLKDIWLWLHQKQGKHYQKEFLEWQRAILMSAHISGESWAARMKKLTAVDHPDLALMEGVFFFDNCSKTYVRSNTLNEKFELSNSKTQEVIEFIINHHFQEVYPNTWIETSD